MLRFIILSLFLLVSLSAQDYLDKESGLNFPVEAGAYRLRAGAQADSQLRKFDDPRLGYSAAYSSPFSEVTIYVFNGGVEGIKNGVSGKWVNHFFQQAMHEVKSYEKEGYYNNIQLFKVGEEFSEVYPKFLLGKKMTYSINEQDSKEKVKSYLFCCGWKGNVFKVRATGGVDSNFEDSLVELLSKFTEQFTK